jgi:hypothetical protein
LPLPEGPRMAQVEPAGREKLMSRTTVSVPSPLVKALDSPQTSSMALALSGVPFGKRWGERLTLPEGSCWFTGAAARQ